MKKLLCVLLMGISSITVAKTVDEYGEMTYREFLNPTTKAENIKGFEQAVIDDYGHGQIADALFVNLAKVTAGPDNICEPSSIEALPRKKRDLVERMCNTTLGEDIIKPVEKLAKQRGLL